jgi:hypothetical protein
MFGTKVPAHGVTVDTECPVMGHNSDGFSEIDIYSFLSACRMGACSKTLSSPCFRVAGSYPTGRYLQSFMAFAFAVAFAVGMLRAQGRAASPARWCGAGGVGGRRWRGTVGCFGGARWAGFFPPAARHCATPTSAARTRRHVPLAQRPPGRGGRGPRSFGQATAEARFCFCGCCCLWGFVLGVAFLGVAAGGVTRAGLDEGEGVVSAPRAMRCGWLRERLRRGFGGGSHQ